MRNTFIILLLIALTGSLVANRNAAEPQDMVRYVDRHRCLGDSDLANVYLMLDADIERINQDYDKRVSDHNLKKADLDILVRSSDEFKILSSTLRDSEERLKFDRKLLNSRIKEEEYLTGVRTLLVISEACAVVGEREGFSSLVFTNFDSRVAPSIDGRYDLLVAQTLAWSNPAYDVTHLVIDAINAIAIQPQPEQPQPEQPQPEQPQPEQH